MTSPILLTTPLGTVVLHQADGALSALGFEDDREFFCCGASDDGADIVRQLREYFANTRTRFEIDLAPMGTDFQRAVWNEVARIPHGETRTYLDIAKALGDRNLTRAVGAANGANPIAIVIPCHRVIGTDGSLTGYAGGLRRKQWLLDHERGQGRLV